MNRDLLSPNMKLHISIVSVLVVSACVAPPTIVSERRYAAMEKAKAERTIRHANEDVEQVGAEASKAISKNSSSNPLDEKNGFRDLRFGDPLPASGFAEAGKENKTHFYARPADSLELGGAKLSGIAYTFQDGLLSGIILETEGRINGDALFRALEAKYGPGLKSNPYIESYAWRGEIVWLVYSMNEITNEGRAAFYSIPLMKKKEADDKLAAELAKDAL